jgi:PAS domain S-box-containing protein
MEAQILVVDDTAKNIQLVASVLKEKNYRVIFAQSGKKALELVEKHQVDLILLDIMMPEMDGFEVAQRLKGSELYSEIPIIFLTAFTDSENIKKGFEVGAQDYVTKPFNAPELLSRVRTHLELHFAKQKLNATLTDNITLLNQYKEVVDESSIVSKTDLKGIITYVNDQFCKISGYTRSELIGKPHNIVRHSDVPKEAFADMWDTIKHKKIWHGEVKNLKKDGGYYVVLSTVKPVVNANNEIIEYMSVRHDITDIYNLREEIENTQKEVIFTMGSIGETRSKETGNHVKRVAEYSRVLAEKIGLPDDEVEMIVQASPMHDIGKVAIPDSVLHKPGKLTDEEFTVMRRHAELGYEMLKGSNRPLMKLAATIALEHHERWDGEGGYPKYCKGEEISIAGRITAVADVFDALGSDRVYKKAWDDEKIFALFKEERGKQFDPQLIDVFFENLDEFLRIRELFKDV